MKMGELKIFNNEELGLRVRTLPNPDGSISISAEDTAIGFGWYQKQNKNGKEYISIRWERMNGFSSECGFPHMWGKDDYIPESLFYRLGMKANNAVADKFQNWLALEVIPEIRKTGSYTAGQNRKPDFENLSPELQMVIKMAEAMASQELEQKRQAEQIETVQKQVESIREVVAIDTTSWRDDTGNILRKIGLELGGGQAYSQVRNESYELLSKRMGVNLKQRLTNKRRRMADEGICKSSRDKLSYVDIISEDKKLIEGYTAIVKEMAIHYGAA